MSISNIFGIARLWNFNSSKCIVVFRERYGRESNSKIILFYNLTTYRVTQLLFRTYTVIWSVEMHGSFDLYFWNYQVHGVRNYIDWFVYGLFILNELHVFLWNLNSVS